MPISHMARGWYRPPELFVSVLPSPEQLVITGSIGAGCTLYLRGAEGFQEKIPVDQEGRFNYSKKRGVKDEHWTLVAVDPRNGGVCGGSLKLPGWNGGAGVFVSGVMDDVLARSRNLAGDYGNEPGNFHDTPLKRVEAAAVLAGILNWPADSGANLTFADAGEVPGEYRQAVAEVQARGIFKGESDGNFVPGADSTGLRLRLF